MDTLTIEQKAKAYDEAIERANLYLGGNQLGDAWIYKILPELTESEDERIRKNLIDYLKEFVPFDDTGKYIAYLEKQGKQKPVKCMFSNDNYTDEERKVLCDNCDEDCKLKQKPTEWSEEDKYLLDETIKHLEALIRITKKQGSAYSDEIQYYQRDIDWLKSLKDRVQLKRGWSEEDKVIRNALIKFVELLYSYGSGIYDLDKNQFLDWLQKLENRIVSK